MKIHWVVFILFLVHGQMEEVILMGTVQIQISKERGKKGSLIVTVSKDKVCKLCFVFSKVLYDVFISIIVLQGSCEIL